MELSFFLAKVIGWYMIISALYIFFRFEAAKASAEQTLKQLNLLFFIAFISILLGLMIVIGHNIWVLAWPVIITLIGWFLLISGILWLFSTEGSMKGEYWWLKSRKRMNIAASIYFIVGLFLLIMGYLS